MQAEGSQDKEAILAVCYCKVTFHLGMNRLHQADNLTSADQMIPDLLVEDSVSGRAETVIKSQFGDIRFHISTSILNLFLKKTVI